MNLRTEGKSGSPVPILYEDNHLLIVNKPFGMLSQGAEAGDENVVDLMKEYIRKKYNKPGAVYLALIHRLDRPVGGVLVLARTSKAAARLSEQFKNRSVRKTYLAIAENTPEPMEGILRHWLVKLAEKNKVKAFTKPEKSGQECVLQYKVLGVVAHRTLLQVQPITGRQHQIRAQFARIACPLVGDVKYGSERTKPLQDQSIGLFAYQIELEHPVTKKTMRFSTLPPKQQPWDLFDFRDL
jgi:23S rRNA pseudouridine1911/1915/1917 synthase